ncbi:MAG: radical SAM family heme chaperone HemW [Phycisphaerales bacterium]|nr:radical SAM family heme chaperone HemW [Phycisphaerales bacterium]
MAHNTPLNVLPQRDGAGGGRPHLANRLPPPGSPGLDRPASLYIHVPFCFHKCHYCDFYSIVDTFDRQRAFCDRLERELTALAAYSCQGPLETIFVGGGTPSLLAVPLWERLLDRLRALFDVASPRLEFTVECNPETVTPELMAVLAAGGVTRVSMGAQSFDTRHLKTLERWHDPESVPRALEFARAAGIGRQSIDLIFGIPGQTLDDWHRDLNRALSLGTEHLSCYSLTYEPQTAMTARLKRGEFEPIDEELEVAMHRATWAAVRTAGMERYEVSNFARPGSECRHNMAYWRQRSWLAAGPSASGHLRVADTSSGDAFALPGHRWKNVPRLDDYLRFDDGSGTSPLADHEGPDAARAVRERIMTGLRLAEGVNIAEVIDAAAVIAPGSADRLRTIASRLIDRGQMLDLEGRWVLTDEGILFADAIAVEFFGAVE